MSASSNPAVRPDRIMEMVWGYAPPIILGTAVQCRVFDLLEAGPKTVEELAAALALVRYQNTAATRTAGERIIRITATGTNDFQAPFDQKTGNTAISRISVN